MHSAASQSIGVDGKSRDQRLALTGLHLGDLALMQGRSADDLDVVMALAQFPHGRLSDGGEGLRQKVIQGFAAFQPLAKLLGLGPQTVVVQLPEPRFQLVYVIPDGAQFLQCLIVGITQYFLKNSYHGRLS